MTKVVTAILLLTSVAGASPRAASPVLTCEGERKTISVLTSLVPNRYSLVVNEGSGPVLISEDLQWSQANNAFVGHVTVPLTSSMKAKGYLLRGPVTLRNQNEFIVQDPNTGSANVVVKVSCKAL